MLEEIVKDTIGGRDNNISFFELNIVIVSVLGGILTNIIFLL